MNSVRVDINMRLVMDASSYAQVGKVLDAIQHTGNDALLKNDVNRGKFDVTSVNTHPCKAMQMDGFDGGEQDIAYRGNNHELPLVTEGG